MEFWGVEVPIGKPLTCHPGEGFYVHVSQAALGENKSGKGNDRVILKVKAGNTEVVVGTLSQGRCDQIPLDLIFDDEFVLSHNSSASSIYCCGYKTDAVKDEESDDDEPSASEEDISNVPAQERGKLGVKTVTMEATPATKSETKSPAQKVEAPAVETKSQISKPNPSVEKVKALGAKLQGVKVIRKSEQEISDGDDDDGDDDDVDDDDDDDEEEDEDEFEVDEMLGDESYERESEEEDDSDSDEPEEKQRKSAGKKRLLDGVKITGVEKKSKLTTPKEAGKPGGKTAAKTPSTPAPTPKRQQQQHSAKKDASGKKTPGKENVLKGGTPSSEKKSAQYFCQLCNRTFLSELGLNQHNSSKHK